MCGSHGFRIREYIQQLNEIICGNRYLRGMLTIGGVRFDINDDLKKHILGLLNRVKTDFKELTEIMFQSSSFLDRIETTGILSLEHAKGLGVVGVPARASGDLPGHQELITPMLLMVKLNSIFLSIMMKAMCAQG